MALMSSVKLHIGEKIRRYGYVSTRKDRMIGSIGCFVKLRNKEKGFLTCEHIFAKICRLDRVEIADSKAPVCGNVDDFSQTGDVDAVVVKTKAACDIFVAPTMTFQQVSKLKGVQCISESTTYTLYMLHSDETFKCKIEKQSSLVWGDRELYNHFLLHPDGNGIDAEQDDIGSLLYVSEETERFCLGMLIGSDKETGLYIVTPMVSILHTFTSIEYVCFRFQVCESDSSVEPRKGEGMLVQQSPSAKEDRQFSEPDDSMKEIEKMIEKLSWKENTLTGEQQKILEQEQKKIEAEFEPCECWLAKFLDTETPVCVVDVTNEHMCNIQISKRKISNRYVDIKFRCPNDIKDELSLITERTLQSELSDEVKERKLRSAIKDAWPTWRGEHTKLSAMRLSKVKSSGYGTKEANLEPQYCIALEVPYKGAIPIGESDFPPDLHGFLTDVYEAVEVPFYHPASYQEFPCLRMGAAFKCKTELYDCGTATIGPFVKYKNSLGEDKTGFISCAHNLFKNEKDYKKENSPDVKNPSNEITCLQMTTKFGTAVKYALKYSEKIDVALIDIGDSRRLPDNGTFPDSADSFDLYNGNMMQFTNGNLTTRQNAPKKTDGNNRRFVIKYGITTGLTEGNIIDTNPTLPVHVFEVHNAKHAFARPGDSDGPVFLVTRSDACPIHGARTSEPNSRCTCELSALGIVQGGFLPGTICKCLDISDCLTRLGITNGLLSFNTPGAVNSFPLLRET